MKDFEKYSQEKYEKCNSCKYEGDFCDCVKVKYTKAFLKVFRFSKLYYHKDFEPKA